MKYVNLHHHSTFSFGDGFGTPEQHAKRAAELGYECIALTEHGNVSSHFQLEKSAIKAGVKPIFGIEAYCGKVDEENRSRFKHHLTILAMDVNGYRNLNQIVTQSYRDFFQNPTVSGRSLADNSDGIVALSGCSGSQLACALLGGKGTPEHIDEPDLTAATRVALAFHDLLGDRYFLEVQPFWELPRTQAMNQSYERLSEGLGIPLVVTCDVHYPYPDDAEMQAVLHAVHRGNETIEDQLRSWNYEVPMTLPDSEEALEGRLLKTGLSLRAAREAIANSAEVAAMCNVTLPKAERLRYPATQADLRPWT